MSTQAQPRVASGVRTAGEFATIVRPQTMTLSAPTLTEVFASDQMVAEFASIGFDLGDSTAQFHQIATDPRRCATERRQAARDAVERADDAVIHARHAMSEDGIGVASLAVEAADDDVVLDAALSIYVLDEFEPGDEHLFGIDLAAILYDCDRSATADSWGQRYTDRFDDDGNDPSDAYESDDPKAMVLDDLFDRADLARS